jgi:hypothetical protein
MCFKNPASTSYRGYWRWRRSPPPKIDKAIMGDMRTLWRIGKWYLGLLGIEGMTLRWSNFSGVWGWYWVPL